MNVSQGDRGAEGKTRLGPVLIWPSTETRENTNPCLLEASEEKRAHDLHDASVVEGWRIILRARMLIAHKTIFMALRALPPGCSTHLSIPSEVERRFISSDQAFLFFFVPKSSLKNKGDWPYSIKASMLSEQSAWGEIRHTKSIYSFKLVWETYFCSLTFYRVAQTHTCMSFILFYSPLCY